MRPLRERPAARVSLDAARSAPGPRRQATAPRPRTRKLTVVAQDPAIRDGGRILTDQLEVPAEELARGPCGYRVHVIDYDASTQTLYQPFEYPPPDADGTYPDPFADPTDATILEDPRFHAQNVYAIVMRTLARFEFALGRRVGWSFFGHQLKVAPHAFAEANAFYSERDEALMFGYFPSHHRGRTVFSCLSHDVVAHETTHALVDGLRSRFTDPSSPDQAAFHEGFSDIVALLSVFAVRRVVGLLIDRRPARRSARAGDRRELVHSEDLSADALRHSLLLGLAEEMGQEMSLVRGRALRQSATLTAVPGMLDTDEYREPHRRGEVLVAAVMNAFVGVLTRRFAGLTAGGKQWLDRDRVTEDAADAADYLLTMAIRALDYTPPVHIEFADFLSAILTADYEIRPDDAKYAYRDALRESFAAYGIVPRSPGDGGYWPPAPSGLHFERVHFESLLRDRDELFRFVWENRAALGLFAGAYTRVESVRPCLRIAPDGFALRETVAECIQLLDVRADELAGLGITKPQAMPDDTPVHLAGGVTLIFDEYGALKYAIANDIDDAERQQQRLQDLWRFGAFRPGAARARRFSAMHRQRLHGTRRFGEEVW